MTARLAWPAALAALLACSPAPAQEDLAREIEDLKKGQQLILQQLQELKQLAQARGAPAPGTPPPNVKDVRLSVKGRPSRGRENAPVTLVEFTDYQCPVCSRHARDTDPQIQRDYVDTGKVRHVVMDLPLEAIHKLAFKAAEASRCAEEQGKYWEMHERLFEQQRSLEPWEAHAEALDLEVAAYRECLSSGRHAGGIRRDMAEAQRLGARGTPTFFLAITDPEDPSMVKGLQLVPGAQPYVAFRGTLENALAAASR